MEGEKNKDKPKKTGLRFTVHGTISRKKLYHLRVIGRGSNVASWDQGRDAQERVLRRWNDRGLFDGIPMACDVNPKTGAKEYNTMPMKDFATFLGLTPMPARCFYEISFSPLDIPSKDRSVISLEADGSDAFCCRDYITPINFHIDAEIFYAFNTIKSVQDWEQDEPYILNYILRFMIASGLIKSRADVEIIILDSSNDIKISRHYIFKIKGGMFYSIRDCSAFSRNLEAHILADKKCGSPQLPTNLWYTWDKEGHAKMFLLDSIYTDHRCFRFVGCTKMGQERYLRVWSGMEDILPRSGRTGGTEIEKRIRASDEISRESLCRSSILVPYMPRTPEESTTLSDELILFRLFEPDGVTPARSSNARSKYGMNGEMVGRSMKAARIIDGINNSNVRVNKTLASIVRSDAVRAMSKLKWKGKGRLTDDETDFSACKPDFAKAMVKDLVEWVLKQTMREIYGDRVPHIHADPSASSNSKATEEQEDDGMTSTTQGAPKKARRGGINDTVLSDYAGSEVSIYRTGFSITGMNIYCQLGKPEHFCPIMHLNRRRAKNPPPGKPASLFHSSNNTGVTISLRKRRWWWSCHNVTCKERGNRIDLPIPDEVWGKYAADVAELLDNVKNVFTVNIAKELMAVQTKLTEL